MNAEKVILERLLDKFARSSHLLEPGVSKRRVMLRIAKKELPEYQYDRDAGIRDEYNRAAQLLEQKKLVQIVWLKGRPIMESIVLNLEEIDAAYAAVGRLHPRILAEQAERLLEHYLSYATIPWICSWRDAVLVELHSRYKMPFALDFLEQLLQALQVYDSLKGECISMRAFSSRCYRDTKYFEREIRDVFLRIACEYDEVVKLACASDALGKRQQLALLNIFARPELYELCGAVKIHTPSGVLDLQAVAPYGIALPSTLVDAIENIDLQALKVITFIENKTNYDEYLLRERKSDELIVYQGGFFSPQQGKLFGKIAAEVESLPTITVRFWADIDLGGIKMYYQLRKIFPKLQAMRMHSEDVQRHFAEGMQRSDAYWKELQLALEQDLYPEFRKTLQSLAQYRVTIEQECFLN